MRCPVCRHDVPDTTPYRTSAGVPAHYICVGAATPAFGETEAQAAYARGLARNEAAIRRSGSHRFNWHPSASQIQYVDGMAAMAEAYVAHVTRRTWLSTGTTPDRPDTGDVEGGLCVRWTDRPDGSLILHPEDPDHLIGVLVVNPSWPLRIVGWLPVRDGKQRRWWRMKVRHPAFFVPQPVVAARPISTLVKERG